jgi:hypothetical protein
MLEAHPLSEVHDSSFSISMEERKKAKLTKNKLIPWSRVILEKLTVNKLPVLYGN